MSESSVVQRLFPHDSFREGQYQTIEAIIKALYDEGYSNVVLDAPTGSGKTALLTTALRYASDGFFSTPQRRLREQIQNDEALDPYIESLKARRDYRCKVSGKNCEKCPVYTSSDQSCSSQGPECSYWSRKMQVMNSDIAVLTFAFLIIDGNIPEMNGDTRVSFGNREVLALDEAHNLAQQVEELHAGFKISPYSLPNDVFDGVTRSAPRDASTYDDVKEEVNQVLARCLEYIGETPPMDMTPGQKQCQSIADKIKWMHDDDGAWVSEVDSTFHRGDHKKVIKLTPVHVGGFLRNFVWNRAEKRIISTATLPYRDNPSIWLQKVGLDPDDTKVINVGMKFPVENRPIHTDCMVASMSSGGFDKNIGRVLDKMNEIAKRHRKSKGLVHTASYSRAEKIHDEVTDDEYPYLHDNMYVHERDRDADVQIEEWQNSDYDMMLSPAMSEGVDLVEDMCRYQILAKVPYPSQGSRLEYVLDNCEWGWAELQERTLIRVVQSYGRAVRSKQDRAEFYVLDSSLNKLLQRRQAPEWFLNAMDVRPPETQRSVFEY